ncbi:MAG: CoA-binding protein [Magnetococcales bacterium]|nr:CoA-binding protein [Magnetococcales bacterium]
MNQQLNFELNKGYNYMQAKGEIKFPYYVGIHSLMSIATREDRVCVLNILGGESRTVTPTSHVYSGGNVVCGTMPGRGGEVMKTAIGNIPVYHSVLEALEAGHRFNVAVVYVPPSGVRDSVIEAVRVNPELKKVVILTEKVSVSHSRMIRQYCQQRGVDVFGANCLGVADAHQHVRIGGALGGTAPEESLVPGSVAIYSNSGNFTTTIATYLLTGGWGTTVSLSSGKDIYIHFAAPEFTYAFHNDYRSQAAVMYIEPGGYYELDISFKKPVVACIVGRWKAKLTRACGHAGAIAGSGDDAAAKEKWFMNKFGVDDSYTPENRIFSAEGAVVTNIAHIPLALTDVMAKRGIKPDFPPRGSLELKPWFGNNQGLELPAELDLPIVKAMTPYDQQIEVLTRQLGTVFPRQNLKDCSGASRMDAKTQVSKIHGISILDASTKTLEENLVLSLIREYPDATGAALANVILNAFVNQSGTIALAAADAARESGNSPNTVLSAAVTQVGPRVVQGARDAVKALVELFGNTALENPAQRGFDFGPQLERASNNPALRETFIPANRQDRRVHGMLQAMEARGIGSVFVDFVKAIAERNGSYPTDMTILAAVTCHLAWVPLLHKRLSLITLNNMPWHFLVFSTLVGCTVPQSRQPDADHFSGVSMGELMNSWSFSETAFLALFDHRPNSSELYSFSVLLGLIITNGPGTISAQGAKGAVSADGPEMQDRIQVNKGYIGFMTHTGYAHGGNGYEAIAFLLDCFRKSGLTDPTNPNHGLDLDALAMEQAKAYGSYKKKAKAEGNLNYGKVPCVNHPIFKGKEVNYDPREVFVADLFKQRNEYNIFHDFYHKLVQALFKAGVSKNVYCVNVDAVIAVLLLKMLWKPFIDGQINDSTMESAAFTTFLFGRMIGSAAEIDDHTNRGRNMDTRTAASQCSFAG